MVTLDMRYPHKSVQAIVFSGCINLISQQRSQQLERVLRRLQRVYHLACQTGLLDSLDSDSNLQRCLRPTHIECIEVNLERESVRLSPDVDEISGKLAGRTSFELRPKVFDHVENLIRRFMYRLSGLRRQL